MKFENIFCIFTTEQEKNLAKEQLSTHFFSPKVSRKDLILEVYGGKGTNEIQDTKPYKNIKRLHLKCNESYDNLCEKTFLANKMCFENFTFKRWHKIDSNKLVKPEIVNLSKNIDYFGSKNCLRRSRLKPHYRNKAIKDYTNISSGLARISAKNFKSWAKKRNLNINPSHFDDTVFYSTWKPYSISFNFAEVLNSCDKYVDEYQTYLAGCEDHMIGKVFQDLSKYKNLSSN